MNMKKYILVFFVLAVLIAPNFASVKAITKDELHQQISVLLAQIEKLKAQLVEMEKQNKLDVLKKEGCFDFKKDLKIGDKGNDVFALQLFLELEGFSVYTTVWGAGMENFKNIGDEASFFGQFTTSAVSKFQEKYADEILKPLGLKKGTGYVGYATRAKLNKLYKCNTKLQPISQVPVQVPISETKKGIVLDNLFPNDFISSPFKITGFIDGGNNWTAFEGQTGTVELIDNNGKKLAFAILKATTEWTKPLVYFSADFTFGEPSISKGKIVFHNEDPSGNNSKTYEFPVNFLSPSTTSITVLSPNGGETFSKNQDIQVRWKGNPANYYVQIAINADDDSVSELAVEEMANTGSATITMPLDFPAGKYKIEIGLLDPLTNDGKFDLSDMSFIFTGN